MKETKNGVTVDIGDLNNSEWMVRLLALGSFLKEFNPDDEVSIYAYEDELIGGLRISEISYTRQTDTGGTAGASMMKCDQNCRLTLAYCEDFCATYGIAPHRPGGWESCLNIHGEARTNILDSLDMKAESEAEYAKQLKQESLIK